jgi:hypothetical protein
MPRTRASKAFHRGSFPTRLQAKPQALPKNYTSVFLSFLFGTPAIQFFVITLTKAKGF